MSTDAYHVAFDVATTELQEIVRQFEQLRARKELIEKVVEALKPVVATTGNGSAAAQPPVDSTATPLAERFDNAMAQQASEAREAVPNPTNGEQTPSLAYISHNGVYFGEPRA